MYPFFRITEMADRLIFQFIFWLNIGRICKNKHQQKLASPWCLFEMQSVLQTSFYCVVSLPWLLNIFELGLLDYVFKVSWFRNEVIHLSDPIEITIMSGLIFHLEELGIITSDIRLLVCETIMMWMLIWLSPSWNYQLY